MSQLPAFVVEAYNIVGVEAPERGCAPDFQTIWGYFDLPAFVHALHDGQPEERLFALFALGYGGFTSAGVIVQPFLHSQYPLERWAAALSLVKEPPVRKTIHDLIH